MIADPNSTIFVSAISALEIAIKRRLGRSSDPQIPTVEAIRTFASTGFQMLDVKAEHAAAVEHLPLLHGDRSTAFLSFRR